MSDGKKDILEFPLEDLEVPQAIVLMMQAATKTVVAKADGDSLVSFETNEERLQLLAEKLEARVEDAIEEAKAVRLEPVSEDAPNEEAVDESDIFVLEDGEILNYKGVVYQKACNERVVNETENGPSTFCMKRWGHRHPDHEDMDGNVR